MIEGKRVLFIDNNEDDLWLFERGFKKLGYIYTGINSSRALDLLAINHKFDEEYDRVYISQKTDVGIVGYDICKEIRRKNYVKTIIGLLLTPDDMMSINKWIGSGANCAIDKDKLMDLLKTEGKSSVLECLESKINPRFYEHLTF